MADINHEPFDVYSLARVLVVKQKTSAFLNMRLFDISYTNGISGLF